MKGIQEGQPAVAASSSQATITPSTAPVAPKAEGKRAPTVTPDGKLDFPGVYAIANVPGTGLTAEQALDMIRNLPAELSIDGKRQTFRQVVSAMSSMGVSSETVLADSQHKVSALTSYSDGIKAQAAAYITAQKAENAKRAAQITQIQAQIAQTEGMIQSADAQVALTEKVVTTEIARLNDVASFLAVDGSKFVFQPMQTGTT